MHSREDMNVQHYYNQQSLLQEILNMTPQQFHLLPLKPSYENIIKHFSLDPSRLLRFLQN